MTRFRKGMYRAVVLLLLLSLCMGMVACSGKPEDATQPSQEDRVEHSVTVVSDGGLPLAGVGVSVYEDDTQAELVWFAKTDDNGRMTFTDIPRETFVAVLSNLPKGYQGEVSYPLAGLETVITLTGTVQEVEDPENVQYELGDMMADFTVTDGETEYTLSRILQEKKAVILNFWYLQCDPCKMEFPYLQAAYEAYGDSVEVLAMNPYNTDQQEVDAFRAQQEYSFPMMIADPQWTEQMDITAYPTTVVIDRFGTVAMIHKGSITEEGMFERIFAFFGSEEYVQTLVRDIEELPEVEEEETLGTAENPIEMGVSSSFTVKVPAEGEVHLNIYRVNGHYMQIRSPYAAITYNGKTYNAANGAVGVGLYADDMMTAVRVVIHNTSDTDQEFTVTMGTAAGTYGNPFSLELGEFTVKSAAGNNQGVFYTYTAPEDGVLTVRCLAAPAGVAYDLVLYNLSTYVYNNLQSNPQKDEAGYYFVSVNVKAGNRIQFTCGALPDDSGAYPAAEFRVEAYMGEPTEDEEEKKETMLYAVTVTDEFRQPVAGVQIYLNVNGETKNVSTDENGIAHTKLEPGTYTATLRIPPGFDARTTEFQLTQAIPTVSLKLDTVEIVNADYTVYVVDEDNAPVAGALVSIGAVFGYTDETGMARFTLPVDAYTVAVSADGYTDTAASFFGDATEMTVTLVKGEGDVVDGVTYSVTVVDYFGNPMNGVTVSFQKNGTTMAMKTVDETGTASRVLTADTYTVALSFASGAWYYASVTLTGDAPNASVVAVQKLSGEYISAYFGEPYCVGTGATYVQLQSDMVNYFVFTPTQAGYYSFTTADSTDVISCWGGNLFYISDHTAEMESDGNGFRINVKQESVDNQMTYVIGVTGEDDGIIVIRRISDALTDIYDLPWSTEWMEGVEIPTEPITIRETGTLTNIDVTQSYELVLGDDGCYHIGSADGPVLYLRLDENAKLISVEDLLANGAMRVYFFDEEGNFLKKEEYTYYMNGCVACMDPVNGLYPVTETMAYILKNYGASVEWFNKESASYLFGEMDVNPDSAWMFACVYFG